MAIRKASVILLTDESGERNSWSISFQADDKEVIVGLHWAAKALPTHEFKATRPEFRQMMSELGFEIKEKRK